MMEQQILVTVARADLVLCTIAHNIPRLVLAFVVGIVAGKAVLKCRGR